MTYSELVCPECGYNSFYAHFDKGISDDPFCYLRLTCTQCKGLLQFVLDLSPTYEAELEPVE